MKRIVILCDGTWNEPSSKTPTNVVRIAQLMRPVDSVGVAQVPIYVRGVGTGEGVTKFSRIMDRYLGGAFGWGLYGNVVDAYRHLVFTYEPGDKIFIFGFSRGAFTARSLAGFIRATGIIPRASLHFLPEAVKRYRLKGQRETHPNSEPSHEFRQKMSPDIATSAREQAWRRDHDHYDGELLRIDYLGVWDSVGALGVPRHIPIVSRFGRGRYEFHDAELSSLVASARHAVALDERRRAYEPTRWSNLDRLNLESGVSPPPYRELFFVGDHGSIGGGGDITDLSSIALDWVIEGAQAAGLEFSAKSVAEAQKEMNPMGPLRNRRKAKGGIGDKLARLFPKDRAGPDRFADTHPTVYTRWAAEAKSGRFEPYRPGSLNRIEAELVAHHETATGLGDETSVA